MSALFWAHVEQFWCILWFVLAFVGQELGPYWAYLGQFWAMLGHFGSFWATLAPYCAHVRGQESKEGKRECEGVRM